MSVITTKKVKTGDGAKTFTANIETFESTMECVSMCRERKYTNSMFEDMPKKKLDVEWYGVKNYEEALKLMNDGWNEKVSELQATLKDCKALQAQKRIAFRNEVHGFAPVVPLAILGVPNSMINTAMKPIKAKVISVYYDMTISCGNSAEQLIKNGRKMVEAIVKLENMGYRVNLFMTQQYCEPNNGDMLVIKIKSANQPLDLKRICFPIMHPAMFRVIGFDWYGKFPKGTYRYGYGSNLVNKTNGKTAQEIMRGLFGDEAIYIHANLIQRNDVNYIVETLKGGKL